MYYIYILYLTFQNQEMNLIYFFLGKKKQQQQKNKELTYQDVVNEDTLSCMYEN